MKRLLIRWAILTVSVVGAALIANALSLSFNLHVDSAQEVGELFLGSAILGLANATLGRLLKLMTIPLRCLTFGLFSLVINAVLLWMVATLDFGFSIDSDLVGANFLAALVGSILISAISYLLKVVFPDNRDD